MIENRDQHLTARVTESDKALVKAAARKEGKRLSEFIRTVTVDRALKTLGQKEASQV